MPIFVYGVNHSATPIRLREKLAITSSRLGAGLDMLRGYYRHAAVLSTCNRTEVYFLAHSGEETSMFRFFAEWSGLPEADLCQHLYTYQDYEAFHHLFEVAAGLDSMIIGEYEVLGQVKNSLEAARKAGMVNLKLERLFSHAILAGRRVRSETGISQHALSISSVAVDQAQNTVGDLAKCRTLVIGAGEAGWLAAEAVVKRGGQLTVFNRSTEKAKLLVDSLGSATLASGNLLDEMALADVVISCTSAPHQVVSCGQVAEVIKTRPDRPLIFIDIAVPRDIDEKAKDLPNVYIYNIDDLNHICRQNRCKRLAEVDRAKTILAEELERFYRWWQSLRNRPVIQALYQKADSIRRQQYEETLKTLPPLDDRSLGHLDAMTQAIVNKLLHTVVDKLKLGAVAQNDLDETVRDLFNLEVKVDEKTEV